MTAVLDPRPAATRPAGTRPATPRPAVPGPQRLLTGGPPDLATHRARHGMLRLPDPDVLRDELRRSGLTGRGGAGFPLWRKLDALAARPGGVVVANGAEGEPASSKDRTLLHAAPHLVLDGLQAAAVAARAGSAVVYVPGESLDVARAAAAARFGDDPVPVRVVTAPAGFLSGEETAVVNAIDGRLPLPGDKARRVTECGVGGRPTAVVNVETLAHAGLVARYGAPWFRSAGDPDEPGTMLVTVSGAAPAGVRELPIGAPLTEALGLVGAIAGPVLVGGFHGAWLAPHEVGSARLSRASLAPFGASPGAGVLVALPTGMCGLRETARIVRHLAESSARRCGPCRNGLPAVATVMTQLAGHGTGPSSRSAGAPPDPAPAPDPSLPDTSLPASLLPAEALRLGALVRGRGACHHPDGTMRLVASALRVFAADVDAHLAGRCLAVRGIV